MDLYFGYYIYVQFGGEYNYYYSAEAQRFLDIHQSENDLDKFNELAEKNNDTGYSYRASYFPGDGLRPTLARGFTNIDIVSDRDYDEAHPAGTSLNDIFRIETFSYARFLDGSDNADTDPTDTRLGLISKLCNDLDPDDLLLISADHILLYPTHASEGKQNITVTLIDEDGLEHTDTVEADFTHWKK